MSPSESHILAHHEGAVGRITLNRPAAINALSSDMIFDLTEVLTRWTEDSDVEVVVLDGAGERGFCAGGDVRQLHTQLLGGRVDLVAAFFRSEYTLNALIAEYPKPVVAIADGVTMGGGIGLAGHATARVVTETSRLAMPETRIGFTPDVGGTWLLANAPGRMGEYLGLTGSSMTAADAIALGFADFFVPADRIGALREALATRADPATVNEIVMLFDETPEPSALLVEQEWIDRAFSASSVAEVLDRLAASTVPRARETLAELEALSPTALAVTLEAVREARAMSGIREALEGEYRRVLWFAEQHPDLVEGIRAQLVDKDRTPRWHPAAVAELASDATIPAREFRPAVPLFSL